ncbi:ATP-dependent DNA helicase RecG [Anatilimnocola floriformis]|uniref:ATP-dependent DNA helicase RecG n=1 Tax=Anatilimnocola floriformis TaxID=2948575 RepID=UPI0020C2F963|nr:ATP-dependent DNA helicase RecG [Anatilimnocola floriformis]
MNVPSVTTDPLLTPSQFLKGIGPVKAELLAKLDLHYARDFIFNFPRAYQDMSELRTVDQLEEGKLASVAGVIEEVDLRNVGTGKSLLGVLIKQGASYLRCLWFNQPYLRGKFQSGRRILISGEPKQQGIRWEMVHPKYELLADDDDVPAGRILPVYSLTEGLNQTQMRRIMAGVVEAYAPLVEDVFPDEFLDTHQLWPIRAALPQMHLPRDQASLEQARRRFIYQELFILQLALAIRKWRLTHHRRAPALPTSARIDARITRLFPFELTTEQRIAIDQIAADMGREVPMNRLLQGDVGSGKTVVAMYAMLLAVAHGKQAALMAPTEVLARQHVQTLTTALEASKVRIGLLVGSLTPAERKKTLDALAAGELDILVGTHAVTHALNQSGAAKDQKPLDGLSDALEGGRFARLGLVVIDEQHKFGVNQRAALKRAGIDPHYLVMTATPIPRTMTMTMFGDLDVSTIRSAPPGRQKIHTYLAEDGQRSRWWNFFRQKIAEGRQGYVIVPLVEETEAVEAASVQQTLEVLQRGELMGHRLAALHGRMTPIEKESAMEAFRRGRVQVLVSTSVVEVGVDVPNATLMTIEGGERFGLAQLHQLRGRISRGSHPGYLCVYANPSTDEAQRRLDAFTRSNDGFELAELDFQLRGPGDLFGTRQHGLPPLRIADLSRDVEIVEEARSDAQTSIAADPDLKDPAYARLKRMVLIRYGEALELGDVG